MDVDDERDLELDVEGGPSWAWDFVQPRERGGAVLVEQRDTSNDEDKPPPGVSRFVASTDSEDRAMDVVKQDWRLKPFKANPVILDNHMSLRVVGRGINPMVPRTGQHAGKLTMDVGWDLENPDPSLRAVGYQHLNGYRKAGSVGFRHGKRTRRDKLAPENPYFRQPVKVETWWGGEVELAGFLFEANELLEFSSATIPMNPEALQRSIVDAYAECDPADTDARLRVLGETVPRDVVADLRRALGDPEQRRGLVGLLWPDILEQLRRDDAARRVLRAILDAGPPAPARPALRGDGLDFLFPTSTREDS